jgi:magnesium transporter
LLELEEIELDEIKELLKDKKFIKLKKYLNEINSADIPPLFDELNEEESLVLFRLLNKEIAAEVFAELDSDLQEKLIGFFTDKELKAVIDDLFMDETVDLIEEMPSNVVKRILKNVDKEDRRTINELLNYPEDSAGSIMTTEFIDLKENMTVEDAFKEVKKDCVNQETIYNMYVLSLTRKNLVVIDLKTLLLADPKAKIKDLMDENVITINTLDDQEEVGKMFDKYNKYALPVVDKEERLVGIVTIDDAMDVMQEENEEDFEKMAAVIPSEDTYLKTSVFTHAKNRIVWLLILMLSATFTGMVLTHYENAFAAMPLLVSFIPMIMGTGGNCGSQSSTLIIRGMAVDEIRMRDFLKVLWKEIRVAVVVGMALFIANSIKIYIQYKDLTLCLALGITLFFTIIISKTIGSMLPMIVKKLKQEPANVAAPVITTVVDLASVIIYFRIATMMLGL